MRPERQSLRNAVEKWLSPDSQAAVHAQRIRRDKRKTYRCVRVDMSCRGTPISIAFFRHDDGSWQVYPPAIERPAMGVDLRSRTLSTGAGVDAKFVQALACEM
jgi:hypothetical protein